MRNRDTADASSFLSLPDEELIALMRDGRELARDALFKRYHLQRSQRLHSPAMPVLRHVREGEAGELYFRALCRASNTFRFGSAATFSTYFNSVLKREMLTADTREGRRYENFALRLDGAPSRDHEDLSIIDAFAIDTESSDPRVQHFYSHLGDFLQTAHHGLNPRVLDVVRLLGEGYSLSEAAIYLKTNLNTVRFWIERLRDTLVAREYKKRTRVRGPKKCD